MQNLQRLMIRTIPLLLLLLFGCVNFAHAQGLSAYFGIGTATDSRNKVLCADTAAGTTPCLSSGVLSLGELGPSMGGAFGTFGFQFMLKPKLGFSGEYAFRFAQQTYAPAIQVNARPSFYDFNGVYQPLSGDERRIIPEFQAGLGGANIKFYETASGCALSNTACATINQYIASSNHFQLHFSAAAKIYVKGNIFVRPAFDFHWVHNLQEYGRDTVPQYTVAVGYTFGSR